MKQVLLTPKQRSALLAKHPEWTSNTKQTWLKRTFQFASHVEALVFVARVTVHAEVLNHHPDITFTYCTVTLKLTTHDLKGISKVDQLFLERIEKQLVDK